MINKQRLLNTFLDYVQIDSESTHEEAFARRVMTDLEAVGCRIYVDGSKSETDSDTGNLYCTLPGNGSGDAIILSAHLDTVVPGVGIKPVIEDGVIRSQGDTVLGGDDKSGVAAIVEAMRTIVERNLPHPTVQAVFTVCEEIGLNGSKALDYSRMAAKKAVVLDSTGDAGTIITGAPGQYSLSAVITGRRAHAGAEPEKGISAIQVAAEAITNMKLLRIDEETTANIGAISANYATNIVPERLELKAEARSRNDDKLEAQIQHMLSCLENACEKYGATLETTLTKPYGGYSYSQDDPFVREVAAACEKAGLKAVLNVTGGGSDANNFNVSGVKALVLGTGMDKVHTTQEQLTVKNLEDTAALVLALATL